MLKKMITPKKLQMLINPTSKPCVTICVPCQEEFSSSNKRKDFFRLQTQKAEAILKKDYGAIYTSVFMDLFYKTFSESIFDQSSHGLVLFYNQHVQEAVELPLSILPQTVVSDCFYLKPLLRYFQTTTSFKLVSLDEGHVGVYEGSPWGISFVKGYHLDPQSSYRNHYVSICWDLEVYNDGRNCPVILMGPEWKQELFYSLNLLPLLYKSNYYDSVKIEHMDEVKKSAFKMIRSMYDITKNKIVREFQHILHPDSILTDLKMIAKGIQLGVVSKLLIASDQMVWGEMTSDGHYLRLHPVQNNSKDNDILSQLAERLIQQGGKVLCVPREEMPNHALALAAI